MARTPDASKPPTAWGALFEVQHSGTPAPALHENLRELFGGRLVRAECCYGAADYLFVRCDPSEIAHLRALVEKGHYGGHPTYLHGEIAIRAAESPSILRALVLADPEDGPRAKDEGQRAYLQVDVQHIHGDDVDVRNAKHALRQRFGGKIARIYTILDEPVGLLVELVLDDGLADLGMIVTRQLPLIPHVAGSMTRIAIRFDAERRGSWPERLRAFFEKRPAGAKHALSTTRIAKELGAAAGTIQRPLAALRDEGFLADHKSRGIRTWWRREP